LVGGVGGDGGCLGATGVIGCCQRSLGRWGGVWGSRAACCFGIVCMSTSGSSFRDRNMDEGRGYEGCVFKRNRGNLHRFLERGDRRIENRFSTVRELVVAKTRKLVILRDGIRDNVDGC